LLTLSIRVATAHSPAELMEILHKIESAYGRTRSAKNAPRTLDLDLIDYHGRVEEGPPVLPHPRMAERGFVLIPLADIAPEWRHPATGLFRCGTHRGAARRVASRRPSFDVCLSFSNHPSTSAGLR